MRTIITGAFLLFTLALQGQNLLDANGKKHGRWKLWMNANWADVKDSTEAVHCRYVHFEHDEMLQMLNPMMQKSWRQEHVAATAPQSPNSKLVHGRYSWFDTKDKLRCVQEFDNGNPLSIILYHKDGNLDMRIDFTQRWMEQPNTALVEVKEKPDEPVRYFWRKIEPTGWRSWSAEQVPDSIAMDVVKEVGDSTFAVVRHYFKDKLDMEAGKVFLKGRGRGVTDGIYHGAYKAWFGNGQRENEGRYHYGKPVGEWKHWNKEGAETVKMYPAL